MASFLAWLRGLFFPFCFWFYFAHAFFFGSFCRSKRTPAQLLEDKSYRPYIWPHSDCLILEPLNYVLSFWNKLPFPKKQHHIFRFHHQVRDFMEMVKSWLLLMLSLPAVRALGREDWHKRIASDYSHSFTIQYSIMLCEGDTNEPEVQRVWLQVYSGL